MDKRSVIAFITIIIVLLVLLCGCSFNNGKELIEEQQAVEFTKEQIKTLQSINKIDDYPLYVMYYEGGYGFKEYLEKGKDISFKERKSNEEIACSTVSMFNREGESFYGRNLDWHRCPVLILFTDPPDGYASVSVVDIIYLGFTIDKDITKIPLEDRKNLLYTPYLPFDGMNEYGVCIGEMTMSKSKASIDPDKVTLGGMEIMRAVLDHAKTTEEAIKLFEKYNVHYGKNEPPMHYHISDPSGNSAIIEYIDGEMKVIRNTEPWHIATNYQLYGKDEEERKGECYRYDKAYEILKKVNGKVNSEQALDVMKEISQSSTQWTSIYNMTTGEFQVVVGRKYTSTKKLKLSLKK